jgi:hypothetical protein
VPSLTRFLPFVFLLAIANAPADLPRGVVETFTGDFVERDRLPESSIIK